MYEDITYEAILDRMLQRSREHAPGIDTRPSSPIYVADAPAAAELQNVYIELDWMLEQIFADTAGREYLIKRCAEQGITPHLPAKAVLKGEFNKDINIGSRFSLDLLNYVAIERIEAGIYRMECETAGADGSAKLGTLVPIEYIPGLTKAELTEVLKDGANEESTEALRLRFLRKVRSPSTSGNKHDYYNWAMLVTGVGAAKVFPLAHGPGTVKVVITDMHREAAGAALVQSVADFIEEIRPIGAAVSVVSAKEKSIAIEANVQLENGVSLGTAQAAFAEMARDLLKSQAFTSRQVSLAQIGNVLLDTIGVEDYSGLLLNGVAGNVMLEDEEIAVVGAVRLGVM